MKSTTASRTLRIIGLTSMMTVGAIAYVQQIADAQLVTTVEAYMPCSEAYYSDPDFSYATSGSGNFVEKLKQRGQFESYEQAIKPVLDEMDALDDEITMFSVDLDAPIGYVANKVKGVDVQIPPDVEKSIQEDMAYPYSRQKVKTLNEKYGQYATFGQQITLVYSTAQTLRRQELDREIEAIGAAYLTPEEKQEYKDLYSSQGTCHLNYGFADSGIGRITVEVGKRPDLDARLREDTTGATFFK